MYQKELVCANLLCFDLGVHSTVEANSERVRAGLAPHVFVAADADLLAAVAEGFITDNPNNH